MQIVSLPRKRAKKKKRRKIRVLSLIPPTEETLKSTDGDKLLKSSPYLSIFLMVLLLGNLMLI